jgi:acyl-CoA thioester hydrolase
MTATPTDDASAPPRAFEHRERVRWQDADLQGVLNNAVYLTLFEQSRLGYFGSLELMRGDAFPFLLGETSVRFERPIRAGATVVVATRVTRLGGKSFDMDYVVRDTRDDGVSARGAATLVWVDEALRSCEIPSEARSRVAARERIAERTA